MIAHIDYRKGAEEARRETYRVTNARGTLIDNELDSGNIEFSTEEFGECPDINLYYQRSDEQWTMSCSTGSRMGYEEMEIFIEQLEAAKVLLTHLNGDGEEGS